MRLQVDNQNEYNVKRQLSELVEKMCALKYGKRRDKLPPVYLKNYLETIAQNLDGVQGQDGPTEALLFAFGNLHEKSAWSGLPEMKQMTQFVLTNYAYQGLQSQNPLVVARACWVYGKYGCYEFSDDKHLMAATDLIVQHLYSTHIAVKVEAALALSALLDHQTTIDLIRPGLGNILKIFLKIMDDIDFEDLVSALRKIVDVYQEEIAPYAISLCQKLSEAYIRLVA